jgi:ABC-type amino acid transport system, permease component
MVLEALSGIINTDPVFWSEILMPAVLQGLLVTLQLILWVAPFGLILGILVAAARVYGPKPVNGLQNCMSSSSADVRFWCFYSFSITVCRRLEF